MADTNKGQTNNPDQHCYDNSGTTSQDPGEVYRSFVRDPRTVFSPAPQMPDPVRGLSDNLDQLCYPSEAPMSIASYIPEEEGLKLPSFTFEGPLDICKWIPDLCDKLPKTFSIDFDGTKPCLVVEGNECYDPTEWDFEPNSCIQDAIECIFKPFSQNGGWMPTASDCDTFYPPGFNRSADSKTCILNCVPDRVAVYEWKWNGSDKTDYYYTTDENETPAGYVRVRPAASGGSVGKISISTAQSAGVYQQGNWQEMKIDKSYVNEAGNLWWPSLPNKKFEGKFRLGNKGAVVEMIIAGKRDGGEWDTRYVLKGFENRGDGYTVGETYELRSLDSSNTLLGYVQVSEIKSQEPSFYILKSQAATSSGNCVPLYHLFSSSRQDSFLTTDLSAESNRIANGSYVLKKILGYVFKNKDSIEDYLCEGETISSLYRYYQSSAAGGGITHVDHRYSLIPLAVNERLKPGEKRLYYKIPFQPLSPLIIRYKAQRGTAGKKSSWGYYFANESGIPQVGYVLRKNMTDTVATATVEIPVNTLTTYAGGYVGFFLIPGGNADTNISDGSQVTFTEVAINGQRAYRAYRNGNLVYARAGVSGNANGGENYIFFSDNQLNPYQKVWTRWSGKIQGWEDWYGGDDDYDDIQVDYNVKWKNGTNYKAEGIQCYVFKEDVLPKVYMTSQVRVGCEADRLFKKSFNDPIIKRLGCGSAVDGTYLPGTCTGNYVVMSNCDQTITCRMDGNITLLSWGCDVLSDFKETTWRMRFTKNGEYILDEVYSAATFPKKGRVLHPTFDVKEGDTLRFELLEIQSGSPNGIVFPKISLYDELNEIHESVINITINTKSHDNTSYTTSVPNDGTGIKQIRIESSDGSQSVIGYDNDATQASLIVNDGDNLWRKLKSDDRNNILYQRVNYLFKKSGQGTDGPIDAVLQVRVEPVMGSNNRYQTKVTIEQLVFKGRGFAVGDHLVIKWPDLMYVGTTRIPNSKKLQFKLRVTGVN